MITFKQFLEAGGTESGKLEITKISLEDALEYSRRAFAKYNRNLDRELPKFSEGFLLAQKLARMGYTKRKDMPVISRTQVHEFQRALSSGEIDIRKPFAVDTNTKNPFPEGLSGSEAKKWLKNGLKIHDGNDRDDVVKTSIERVSVSKLIPIQEQIYLDNPIDKIAKEGVDASKEFIKNAVFVTSSDYRIIDGHHRFLSALLKDVNTIVPILKVALPIKMLLPLATAYGDAIGNSRNK